MPTKTERAIRNSRTVFLNTVQISPKVPTKSTGLRVLKSAKSNSKLSGGSGGVITRGPRNYRGKRMFSLTLEERATCPSDCPQWKVCYGNHMFLAKRYEVGLELTTALEADLRYLDGKYPEGFVIRLHILGDFYSVGYVEFWGLHLEKYPNMAVYGYTHRQADSHIGIAITDMVQKFPHRCSILRSDPTWKGDPLPAALTIHKGKTPDPNIVTCPEQTGKSESCFTCGLCFNGRTSVQFLQH